MEKGKKVKGKKKKMEGSVATIGMFDGVHRGHQFVLRRVVGMARQRGLQSLAVTFDHTLRSEPVLTPLAEKLALIKQTGIDRVEVIPFTDALRQMTAFQFMQQVLQRQLHVKLLLTGYDNRFGRNREEGFDDYVRYGRDLGIEVCCLPPAPLGEAGGQVSSSLIRSLLMSGAVAEASSALGYPYQFEGRVEHGEHIGTQLGFPTANLVPTSAQQLIPAKGVYAVWVDTGADQPAVKGMMNVGMRPTFGQHDLTLEVHLLDYHGDLYGHRLTVSFVERLRGEQHFADAASLKAQLLKDREQAEQLLNSNNNQ